MGDAAWTLELGAQVDADVNAQCAAIAQALAHRQRAGELQGIRDIVPTFRSVTVLFDPMQVDAQSLGNTLLQLAATPNVAPASGLSWQLPVCFDDDYAPDLANTAQRLSLSPQALVDAVLAQSLRVYAMGFLPGFAYLAQLPHALKTSRLAAPRNRVPAQSLAIADDMACIYPWVSPGGWNLIGCMPLQLFDKHAGNHAALLSAGDTVSFVAVNSQELQALQRAKLSVADVRAQYARSALTV
jgi:KipI family sensor histidine kinase inhibitor